MSYLKPTIISSQQLPSSGLSHANELTTSTHCNQQFLQQAKLWPGFINLLLNIFRQLSTMLRFKSLTWLKRPITWPLIRPLSSPRHKLTCSWDFAHTALLQKLFSSSTPLYLSLTCLLKPSLTWEALIAYPRQRFFLGALRIPFNCITYTL